MPIESVTLHEQLQAFQLEHRLHGKGALAVVLHVSRYAVKNGFPINVDNLITGQGGQVLGLGKDAVQRILADYGIARILAEEGGRTSRGSLGLMRDYVGLLNQLHMLMPIDANEIELWWINKVKVHFAAKPFKLKFDASKSLQSVIHELLAQARKKQQESTGTMYQGAMLQHLVGAKLELAMPELTVAHSGFSVSDASNQRAGDFVLDNVAIHVTTAPGEALLRKCLQNIEASIKPIILTLAEGVAVAKGLADNLGIAGRIDVMDAEQFIAANLHELSLFNVAQQKPTFEKLIQTYNSIVVTNETDPSLNIEMA
jgi:Domain of unknown function (DUF4928)